MLKTSLGWLVFLQQSKLLSYNEIQFRLGAESKHYFTLDIVRYDREDISTSYFVKIAGYDSGHTHTQTHTHTRIHAHGTKYTRYLLFFLSCRCHDFSRHSPCGSLTLMLTKCGNKQHLTCWYCSNSLTFYSTINYPIIYMYIVFIKVCINILIFTHTYTHIHIYIFVNTYSYLYIYVYIHIYLYNQSHRNMHIYIYIYIYICVCVCVCVWDYIHIYICIYIYIYIYKYFWMYIRIFIHLLPIYIYIYIYIRAYS